MLRLCALNLISVVLWGNLAQCIVIPKDPSWLYRPLRSSHAVRIRRDALQASEPICHREKLHSSTLTNTTDRLRRLRDLMKINKYDAYIVPSSDEHQSEYVSNYDKRREYISGFTGSAGIAVVTLNESALWTDGRYYLQALSELDCNWVLVREDDTSIPEWLLFKLNPKNRVGVDSRLLDYSLFTQWEDELQHGGFITLVGKEENLIDDIWQYAEGRSIKSKNPIYPHDIKYAGKSWEDKVSELRQNLKETGTNSKIDGFIISALDEIAWLFNLRGADIPYNPVFKSYAFLYKDLVRLYVDLEKVTSSVREHLHTDGCNSSFVCVQIKDYDEFYSDVENLLRNTQASVLVPNRSSYAIYKLVLRLNNTAILKPSPIMYSKAIKNPTEIKRMKDAYLRDAIALIDFMAMLESEVKNGVHWTEISAAKELREYRKREALNQGESFETISAFGPNGAIIHYSPQEATNNVIDTNSMYLLDSGGQYLDGTVDTTRTFHFGTPTAYEKEVYTRVLMGFIDTVSLQFPFGVRDIDIDILTRRHLYDIGLDYLHGTGHGIGFFLGVHEGPIHIALRSSDILGHTLEEGMFTSLEPGYYEEGRFGIRLETVVVVTEARTKYNFQGLKFMKFEPIALVPFEPKLIINELLSDNQRKWLNDFNTRIRNTIGRELRLQDRKRAFEWLLERTEHMYSHGGVSDTRCLSYIPLILVFIVIGTML